MLDRVGPDRIPTPHMSDAGVGEWAGLRPGFLQRLVALTRIGVGHARGERRGPKPGRPTTSRQNGRCHSGIAGSAVDAAGTSATVCDGIA